MNESWRLVPQAEVLYGCDGAWWRQRRPEFSGLRLTQDPTLKWPGVEQVRLERGEDRLLLDEPGVIGNGGHSGFQALNLVVQFGARCIALVGYDMRLDRGAHWHGPHRGGLNNPGEFLLPRWRRVLNQSRALLDNLGVEVICASPGTTLTAFPILPVEELLRKEP